MRRGGGTAATAATGSSAPSTAAAVHERLDSGSHVEKAPPPPPPPPSSAAAAGLFSRHGTLIPADAGHRWTAAAANGADSFQVAAHGHEVNVAPSASKLAALTWSTSLPEAADGEVFTGQLRTEAAVCCVQMAVRRRGGESEEWSSALGLRRKGRSRGHGRWQWGLGHPAEDEREQTAGNGRLQLGEGREAIDLAATWHEGSWVDRRPGVNMAMLAALFDGFKPYYWDLRMTRPHPTFPLRDASFRLFLRQFGASRAKQQQWRAEQLPSVLNFHSKFQAAPFQLPNAAPLLPLTFTRGDYHIAIVTTACLPWLTGTSINPLLRAAYLEQLPSISTRVTIIFPWIAPSDQRLIHPSVVLESREQQAAYVRQWVEERVGRATGIRILFYDAWYDKDKGSIFPLDRSDLTELIQPLEADVVVLEEPEHLCWYHLEAPKWRSKFSRVIGIAHTNYLEYIRRDLEHGGPMTARFLYFYNQAVTSANCHHVIRLSGAVQPFPNSSICNVHGVSPSFLRAIEASEAVSPSGFYFVGKTLWGKGYRELCDLLLFHCQLQEAGGKAGRGGSSSSSSKRGREGEGEERLINGHVERGEEKVKEVGEGQDGESEGVEREQKIWLDIYGDGFQEQEIRQFATHHHLPMTFHGRRDHADPSIRRHKVFVNPSLSDVLCTTTAEAAAMAKLLVLPDHPSNSFFFENFSQNCIIYDPNNPHDFSRALMKAIHRQPSPLTKEQAHIVTWEAATDRFMKAAGLV